MPVSSPRSSPRLTSFASPLNTPHATPHLTAAATPAHAPAHTPASIAASASALPPLSAAAPPPLLVRQKSTISALTRSLYNVMWHATNMDGHRECEHVSISGNIDESSCLSTIQKPDSWCCFACETSNAIRMCLACGTCACERHSYVHYENSARHTLFLQLNAPTKPVFCYTCRFLVSSDHDHNNQIKRIRDVLEDVQTMNVEILSKTTRSGRKRIDGSANAAASTASAAATSHAAIPSALSSSTSGTSGDSIMMSDIPPATISADDDILPTLGPSILTRQHSVQQVKNWQKAMPYLGPKAQRERCRDDILSTALFRWRNRKLVAMFMTWKAVAEMGKEERHERKAKAGAGTGKQQKTTITITKPTPTKRMTRSSHSMDAVSSAAASSSSSNIMAPLALDQLPEEDADMKDAADEEADTDVAAPSTASTESTAPAGRRKSSRLLPVPPAPVVTTRPQRKSDTLAPPSPSTRTRKRSKSEERRPSSASTAASSRLRKRPNEAADDLLSPTSGRAGSRSPRSSSPSMKGAKTVASIIKLAPGVMGLRNLGNTCYMNSVVQALSLTSQFRSYYIDCIPSLLPPLKHAEKSLLNARAAKNKTRKKKKAEDRERERARSRSPSMRGRGSTSKQQQKQQSSSDDSEESDTSLDSDDENEDHSSLTRDFSDLLTTIWKGQRIVYTPDHFLQTVWTLYERFKGFKQQDAQEFVLFLLNQLSKEQEFQLGKRQKLEKEYQNPQLERAKERIRNPRELMSSSEINSSSSTTSTSTSGRKRKAERNNSDTGSTAMTDSASGSQHDADGGSEQNSDEQPTSRRRSNRSTTITSTTSSASLADQVKHAASSSGPPSLSKASSYTTPIPPSSLVSLDMQPPPSLFVSRTILQRENDFITQNFAGVLRSEIRCTVCKKVSVNESEFLGMISVQIPPKTFLTKESEESQEAEEAANGSENEGEDEEDEDDDDDRPTTSHRRSVHHSSSASQLAGGSSSSVGTTATFLSVSRSLSHSRSEQVLPASTASISQRNRVRHAASSCVTLQKCLSYTFNSASPEIMDGVNAYQCGSCKKRVRAEKYQLIQALPPEYLFIHIGRTVYDMTTFSSKKDQTHIQFPFDELDMTPFLPTPTTSTSSSTSTPPPSYIYELYSVVSHHGRGLNEGHFVAQGYSEQHECWLLFNDARVNVVTPEKVAETQAYLLFYKRKDPNGTPRPVSASPAPPEDE